MYDKLRLYSPRTRETPDISQYLDRAKEQTDLQTGEVSIYGSLNGLKIGVYCGGISIVGSLSKYMYGNNICPLDVHTTAKAIEKLSDALHVDLSSAKVTGLEFGTHFVMKKIVPVYLRKLGDLSRMVRTSLVDGSVYYKPRGKEQAKVLCFYDKAKEADVKEMAVPEGLSDANLLRYEIRINKRVPKQLGVAEVLASTLSEKDCYTRLVRLWQNNYFSISKMNQPTMQSMENIKSVSEAYDVLVARLISQTDQSQITAFLEELKDAKAFDNRVYYTRLKQKIDAVIRKASLSVDDDIRELDDDVKNAGAYI